VPENIENEEFIQNDDMDEHINALLNEKQEEPIIVLEVSPILKDVDVEEFAMHSSKVLARKLQMHSIDPILPITESEAIKFLKKLFTSANFAIIPQHDLIEQLPNLKVLVDVESMIESLLIPVISNSDELEGRLLNYMEEKNFLKFVVIDLNNELQLYKLPQGNDPNKMFKETLIQTIEMYQGLLTKQRTNGQDTSNTEQLLKTLRIQLAALYKNKEQAKSLMYNTSKSINKDQRIKALDEIFHFYTKQLALAHVRKTFDVVQKEKDTMTLGYYVRFLKDFRVEFDLKVNLACNQ